MPNAPLRFGLDALVIPCDVSNVKRCKVLFERIRGERLRNAQDGDIIKLGKGGRKHVRYPVTQQQIDEILASELKDYRFPVQPVYNSRLQVNGIARAEVYPWGKIKRIKAIEIGKQDLPGKNFLIDTLLHEYFEAEILLKQDSDEYYRKLGMSKDHVRHRWISSQIVRCFKELKSKR